MTALVYTGFSIATVLGLPLGTLIADLWNWQAAFIMVAVVTAISTVLAAILVPRKLAIPASGMRDQLTLLRDKNIWLGIGFVTCAAATLYGYYTYIRPLIRQTLGFSTTMLSAILMLLGGIDVISSLLSGRLGAKNGMRRLHGVYLAILFLLALFSTAMRTPATGILVLSLLGLLIPLFSSPIQLYFLNITSSKYPTGVMLASSLSPVFYNIGITTSSLTAATTLRHFGLANLGWNSFAYALITLLLLVLINRRTTQAGQR
jgi:predicted MFS family arabinose efflux permease